MSDEFYVGYQPEMPAGHARFVRRVVLAALVAIVILATAVVALQSPYANSRFDYGRPSTIEGVVRNRPVPHLGPTLLVGQGKQGAVVAEGASRVTGPLIERDGMRMLEVHEAHRTSSQSVPVSPRTVRGAVTLRGEIVDSKCWLGVMNPGEKKVHRACASLCIRGGIPPMLVTREGAKLLLVDASGRAMNERVLPFVAELVEITGTIVREGELDVLWVDDITRVPAG